MSYTTLNLVTEDGLLLVTEDGTQLVVQVQQAPLAVPVGLIVPVDAVLAVSPSISGVASQRFQRSCQVSISRQRWPSPQYALADPVTGLAGAWKNYTAPLTLWNSATVLVRPAVNTESQLTVLLLKSTAA